MATEVTTTGMFGCRREKASGTDQSVSYDHAKCKPDRRRSDDVMASLVWCEKWKLHGVYHI